MHHALEIQEILFHIFVHCRRSSLSSGNNDLPALARTCRAFKEPALDVLWACLDDLSPLVRCVPDACLQLCAEPKPEIVVNDPRGLFAGDKYLFTRLLTPTEWDTIRGFARRIRSVIEIRNKLDEAGFRTLSNPPFADPLLPSLRCLRYEYTEEACPLLHQAFPSLTSLDLVFQDLSVLQDFFAAFPDRSPNVGRLCVRVRQLEDTLVRIEPDVISRWQRLQSVVCPQVTLAAGTLAHLARMPGLTRLTCKQIVSLSTSSTPLVFHTLRYLTVHAPSLSSVTGLLSHVRLPALTDMAAHVLATPTRPELASFLAALGDSGTGLTSTLSLEYLTINQPFPAPLPTRAHATGPRDVLDLDDLRACTAWKGLRGLTLDIGWDVGLGDGDVRVLAEAWPKLERWVVNGRAGWGEGEGRRGRGERGRGVTPDGLALLLETCPDLNWVALALDTRGYAPSRSTPGVVRPKLTLDLLDSVIDAKSVLAVTAFFNEVLSCEELTLAWWRGVKREKPEGWETYRDRWKNVFRWSGRGVRTVGG